MANNGIMRLNRFVNKENCISSYKNVWKTSFLCIMHREFILNANISPCLLSSIECEPMLNRKQSSKMSWMYASNMKLTHFQKTLKVHSQIFTYEWVGRGGERGRRKYTVLVWRILIYTMFKWGFFISYRYYYFLKNWLLMLIWSR